MKITLIFAERLFSFRYDRLFASEYEKKLNEWQDFEYIYNKAVENNIDITLIDTLFDEIFFDREFFKNKINQCCNENTLFDIFKNLSEKEISTFESSKVKMYIKPKQRLSRLRLYALRVSNTCFVITGGAIKFSQKMQDHPDTLLELDKLKKGRQFLIENNFSEDDIIDNLFESDL